jgi:hypothetical protein
MMKTGRLKNLMNLKYINGEIYANVKETDRIARSSPDTGRVTGLLGPKLFETKLIAPFYFLIFFSSIGSINMMCTITGQQKTCLIAKITLISAPFFSLTLIKFPSIFLIIFWFSGC